MGFFGFGKKNKEKEQEKMKTGLEKTRTGFWGNILNTLTGSVIDDDMYDDLEEQLILADVGGEVAVRLVDKLPTEFGNAARAAQGAENVPKSKRKLRLNKYNN